MAANSYFQECLLGLAHAEGVLRRRCQLEIANIKKRLNKSFAGNKKCIHETQRDILRRIHWHDSQVEFSHACHKKPACYTFLNQMESKILAATKVSIYVLLRNDKLQDWLDNEWALAQVFIEPWMRQCHGFNELDAFCLLVMLDNIRISDITEQDKESPKRIQYKEYICKMRDIAEACFLTDTERLTEEDRYVCLITIINLLAVIPEGDADGAIQKIHKVMEIESETERPTLTSKSQALVDSKKDKYPAEQAFKSLALQRRANLKKQKENMKRKVANFLSEIPRDVGLAKTNFGRKRRSEEPHVILKKTKQSTTTHKLVFKLENNIVTHQDRSECIQALIYLVEKNEVQDTLDIKQQLLKLMHGESGIMASSHYEKLQKMLETGPLISLSDILIEETESMYFKVCHQSLLMLKTVLRRYCETRIATIQSDVRKQFHRDKLCSSAVSDDLSLPSKGQGVQFKHKCTQIPECNRFLQVVMRKRSVHCKLNPYNMFKIVDPQQCLTNVWSFAKLFMEPWMHKYNGFKDLDAYPLLTLALNIRKPYANKRQAEPLQWEVRQVRDFSRKVLTTQTRMMTKKDKDQCLGNIIYVLENGIFPKPSRAIKQINDLKEQKMPPLFDIRLGTESKRKRCRQSLQVVSHRCWYKNAMALAYIPPALLPIVERNIRRLHRQTVREFGPKPCARAKSYDIIKYSINEAKFKHACPPGTPVACKELLKIIKRHTVETVKFFNMLQGSDPQTWLESPLDFLRIFLENSMRRKINEFEDCDITVLCQIIRRLIPLMEVFKDVQNQLSNVKNVRNEFMHKPYMCISQEDMEDNLAAILELLELIKPKNDTEEVAAAIHCIKQLQAGDPQYFLRDVCVELLQGVLTDARMERQRKLDEAETLYKNILYMEEENTRLSSLENITEFPSPAWTVTAVNDQHNLPSTSCEMGSMTMEGFPQPTENIQREMAEKIKMMSPKELRAAFLKANEKDPRLVSELLRPQSSSHGRDISTEGSCSTQLLK